MKPSILHLILLNIGIVADAYIDNYLISKGKEVHNMMQYLIREMFFILLAAIFAHFYDNEYALYSWVLSHVVYWWTFDTLLNILRYRSFAFKDLIYLSEKGIDRIQRPLELWFFVKLFICILASAYFFNQGLYQL